MTSRLEREMCLAFFYSVLELPLLELSNLNTVNTILLISTANQQPNLSSFTLSQLPFFIYILFRAPASSLFLSYSNGLTIPKLSRAFPYLRPFLPLLSLSTPPSSLTFPLPSLKNTHLLYLRKSKDYLACLSLSSIYLTVFLFPASYSEEKRHIIL